VCGRVVGTWEDSQADAGRELDIVVVAVQEGNVVRLRLKYRRSTPNQDCRGSIWYAKSMNSENTETDHKHIIILCRIHPPFTGHLGAS